MLAQQPTARPDRRTAPRCRSRLPVPCNVQSTTLEGRWTAVVTNTSRRDVRLIATRPFKPGMLLSISMPCSKTGSTRLRFVRVSSCRPRQGGTSWAVEGSLDEPLGDTEMFCVQVRCPLVHAIKEGPWWLTIRNVSQTGVSLIAERPFPRGALLTVQLPTDVGRFRLARVVHTRRQPGSPWFVTGSALLAPLTGRELKGML
jgi:PilZ domain